MKLRLILLFMVGVCIATEGALGWNKIKQKHFIIYYADNRAFAQRVGYKAEEYYTTISSDLGFTRHDGFWLWDNRAKIYIYNNREDFAKAVGAPEWAAGKANPAQRLIATYEGSREFIDSLLPHEMTHLIFMEFIGFNNSVPLWLNEGVAQWEDKLRRDKAMVLVKRLYALNRLTPLVQLTRLDVRTVSDTGEAVIFYAQSVSLVGFMIKKYGPERFRKFCGQLRDGKSINDALRFTYSKEVSTIGSLEKLWHGYLKEIK